VIFSYPLAFGVPVRNIAIPFGTRIVGLPDGEKILKIHITVYTQYRRVTDRHLATA